MPRFLVIVIIATALLPGLGLGLPAFGQEVLKTEPHLSLAFPFDEVPGGVSVKYPVLINTTTVVRPGQILRVIYTPFRPDDAQVVAEQQQLNQDVAYTRHHQLKALDPDAGLTAQEIAALKYSRETHWPTANMFQLAIANQPSQDLRIVFADVDKTELHDASLALPDGLFLAAVGDSVRVLAVEAKSPSDRAGAKAGNVITAVDGRPLESTDLMKFMGSLNEAKRAADLRQPREYALTVRGEDGTERQLAYRLPPSLKSGFLDQPILDVDAGPSKPAPDKPAMPEAGPWLRKKPAAPAPAN